MEDSLHAILLLATLPIGGWLCWRYRGTPARRWWIAPRIVLALVVFVLVWIFTAGMFECACGPANNPISQGLLPALMAAGAIVFIRDWKPKVAVLGLMVAFGYGLSWHFHELALGAGHRERGYLGWNYEGANPPESDLWHTPLTGIRRSVPQQR